MTHYNEVANVLISINQATKRIQQRLPAFAAALDANVLAEALAELHRVDKDVWEVADRVSDVLYTTS